MYVIPDGVKVIDFDIWLTLLNGNSAFTVPRLQRMFAMLDHAGINDEILRNAYRAADGFYNKESERTGLDYGLRERLAHMFRTLDIDDRIPNNIGLATIQAQVATMRLREEYMPSFIEPDLPATLEALCDQGYRLGLLSNTGIDNEQVMEPVLRKLGIWHFFEVAMFSSVEGLAKPNPKLYDRLVNKFGVEHQEVLHVGDNTNADYRAIEAGLQAVVYAPNGVEDYPHIRSMKELLKKS